MTVDQAAVFPLYISCNFLLHTPVTAAAAADDDDDAAASTASNAS